MNLSVPVVALIALLFGPGVLAQPAPKWIATDVGKAFHEKHVEFRGVAAGAFDPRLWESASPHLVPDLRHPLLEPREGEGAGPFRNIYAPSVVQRGDGWHLYYGGWDGVISGNDRIYRVDVDRDFLAFANRRTVIEHGAFHHVCNVNVVPAARGDGYVMACTAYPAADGLNKPVTFFSDGGDGDRWNTAAARREDLVAIDGYEQFAAADINGMNVLLAEEDGKYRLFFNDFRNFGKTFRATSDDARTFRFDGVVHEPSAIVNDVKRFSGGGRHVYLMGLHRNGPQLFYSLAGGDGTRFGPMKELASHVDEADRHITSIGWVVAGAQDDPHGRRLLGFLYGAGAAPSLDRNRIFARWLQKRVVIDAKDLPASPVRALGPDRQLVPLAATVTAALNCYDESGAALIGTSDPVELRPGRAYSLQPTAAAAPPVGAGAER